ncbi:MAG: ISL3 family transposase [Sutterella seckii]
MATFDTLSLFTAALMLPEPWYIEKVEFPEESNKARALHLYIKFRKGARFPDPAAVGSTLTHPVYDTQSRIWRHMNFFQYQCYLHCEVPRITGGDGKVRQVSVPWARPGSGFTLLFEALMLMMSQSAPVASCAKQCEVTDNRLWRIIQHYVEAARAEVDLSGVTAIGIDETSKKGTDYVTVFADLETGSVINVQDGKDSSTVDKFALDFAAHGGLSEAVTAVTSDMSLAFDRGIKISLPNAEVIIDKFHVVKNCNDALDQVRRRESKTEGVLKKSRYLWLKNFQNLNKVQQIKQMALSQLNLQTGRAYRMRLSLQNIYQNCETREDAELKLKEFCSWLMHARIPEMKRVAKMIRNHWEGILNYWTLKVVESPHESSLEMSFPIKIP